MPVLRVGRGTFETHNATETTDKMQPKHVFSLCKRISAHCIVVLFSFAGRINFIDQEGSLPSALLSAITTSGPALSHTAVR